MRIICCIVVAGILAIFTLLSLANPEAVIKADIASQDAGDWETFLLLRTSKPGTPENRDDIALLMENSPTVGVWSNVIQAELRGIKRLPLDLVSTFSRVEEYCNLYEKVAAYYVAIFYQVKQESRFTYNGVNYRLYVLGLEEGQWEIVEVSGIPIQRVLEAGYGFNTPEEKIALWIQEMALQTGKFIKPEEGMVKTEEDP